jgi:hypothetical protein
MKAEISPEITRSTVTTVRLEDTLNPDAGSPVYPRNLRQKTFSGLMPVHTIWIGVRIINTGTTVTA